MFHVTYTSRVRSGTIIRLDEIIHRLLFSQGLSYTSAILWATT